MIPPRETAFPAAPQPARPVTPIDTLPLFEPLSAALLSLLRGLTPEQWQLPTVCGDWTVQDVVAHLLGGNLGRLSFQRDRLPRARASAAPASNEELAAFINRANADWVRAAARLSPRVLGDFIELTDRQVEEFFRTLVPEAPADIGVSWAGERSSANWFDVARELTEKWTHQQHIRDATGRPGLTGPEWLFPVLDTFMRALPYTYRAVDAPEGTALNFSLTHAGGGRAAPARAAQDADDRRTPAGGEEPAAEHIWSLVRHGDRWQLFYGASPNALSSVSLAGELAWRLFTRGIEGAALRRAVEHDVQISGDRSLGEHIATMVSIVA